MSFTTENWLSEDGQLLVKVTDTVTGNVRFWHWAAWFNSEKYLRSIYGTCWKLGVSNEKP